MGAAVAIVAVVNVVTSVAVVVTAAMSIVITAAVAIVVGMDAFATVVKTLLSWLL